MPLILAYGRLRQEEQKFKVSLGYTASENSLDYT